MGYSIFVPFATENERDKLHDFLSAEFRSLAEIVPNPKDPIDPAESAAPYRDVNYTGDYNVPMLGYDYGAGDSDIERGYRFAICYWMAINGGKSINGEPVMVYDGCDEWTICDGGPTCDCEATVHTDKDGYRKIQPLQQAERIARKSRLFMKGMLAELETIDNAVQQELQRLTEQWRKKQSDET